MGSPWFTGGGIVFVIFGVWLFQCIRVLREYERAVIFRLGRLLSQPKGPGLVLIFYPIDKQMTVSLRTVTVDVPPQDIITKDNVKLKVNEVLYFQVIDPNSDINKVANFFEATSQIAQTTLRSVL